VNIEISTACNLKCKMCKRETIDFGNQLMPSHIFKKIIDSLHNEVKLLSLGGYGEMLLHPDFFEMVCYVKKKKGIWTQTTSNGTLLTNEGKLFGLLNCGLDELRISIDHVRAPVEEADVGHVFSEKLLSGLKKLIATREEYGSRMLIGINTVVHKGNFDEILDIIHFAEELKLDFIELIHLDTCSNKAKNTLPIAKEKALYKQIAKMRKKIRVISPENKFSGIRRLYYLKQEYCPFRLKTVHIRINGAVTPCSFGFAAHDFGNLLERDLKEIWQSAPFRAVRKNDKNPVCKNCGIFKRI
jgi:MoaA/NifB/PqqE/SkfB family radical SAM enzyme